MSGRPNRRQPDRACSPARTRSQTRQGQLDDVARGDAIREEVGVDLEAIRHRLQFLDSRIGEARRLAETPLPPVPPPAVPPVVPPYVSPVAPPLDDTVRVGVTFQDELETRSYYQPSPSVRSSTPYHSAPPSTLPPRVPAHTSDVYEEVDTPPQGNYQVQLQLARALEDLQLKEKECSRLQQELSSERYNRQSTSIKPTRYDGRADLEDYLAQFNQIASFNGWTPVQKTSILYSKLEGEALSAVTVLEEPSWTELVCQLRETFSSERQELASLKLQQRRQQKDESLDILARDIQKLVRKAYPCADLHTRERLEKDSFITAVQDASIRHSLRDKNLPNLRHCLQEAKRCQANLEIERARVPPPPTSQSKIRQVSTEEEIVTPEERIGRLETEFSNFKQASAKASAPPPPRKSSRQVQSKFPRIPTCWNCTMLGHTERYCPFEEETVTRWIKEGRIQIPKNRREPSHVPGVDPRSQGMGNTGNPRGNLFGRSGYGPPAPQ